MLVMTRGINDRVATDTDFAKRVSKSVGRFMQRDWGDVAGEDWVTNAENYESLEGGGGGMVLASYLDDKGMDKICIIRDTEAITVLYPSEY